EEGLVKARRRTPAQEPRADQRMRIEGRDAEALAVRLQKRDEAARRERLRRRVHLDLVRVYPGMAALGALLAAGLQRDDRPLGGIVSLHGRPPPPRAAAAARG